VDSIDPVKLTTGLSYQHVSGFGAQAVVVAAMRQERVSSATYFRAPAYATLDLMAHYELNERVTLNAGLFNVTNTKYFNTQDVVGLSRTSAMRDLFAQTGRYLAVNATVRW
jgi:hemoglobin/transferrin/lactoferrin receptor protein